jgi:hypothetical protein
VIDLSRPKWVERLHYDEARGLQRQGIVRFLGRRRIRAVEVLPGRSLEFDAALKRLRARKLPKAEDSVTFTRSGPSSFEHVRTHAWSPILRALTHSIPRRLVSAGSAPRPAIATVPT